jgi:hypothetical protein
VRASAEGQIHGDLRAAVNSSFSVRCSGMKVKTEKPLAIAFIYLSMFGVRG